MNSLRVRSAARLLSQTKRNGLVQSQQRSVHHVRSLPYGVEDGLGEFLSPQALKVVAQDYQQGLLERLNELVKGMFYPTIAAF